MENPREVVAESMHDSTYIVDLMAALRSIVQIPENYEELTWKMLYSFPKGFQRVDIEVNITEMSQLRLEKEKVVDVVIRSSLNRLSLRYQKIFKLSCEMVKIRTGS